VQQAQRGEPEVSPDLELIVQVCLVQHAPIANPRPISVCSKVFNVVKVAAAR
jgi:hypothetical protein